MIKLVNFAPKLRCLAAAVALVGLAFTLASCEDEDYAVVVTAVQPFYAEQDLNTDAGLVGTWQYEDEVTFTFTPAEDHAYNVIVDENGNDRHINSRFEGHLFHLGADSFLDLYPASVPEGSEFYFFHFFRCHTVFRVDFVGNQLEMRFLSPTWLLKQLKGGTISVAHAKSGDILLLTASTQEMQDFLFMHASDEDAFPEELLFERAHEGQAQEHEKESQ